MNTPSEVVSEHDDESGGRSKLWSAYILGYNGVMVRVWQQVFWHMPGEEWGTWDSVPLCLDQLGDALTCLADEVVPEVRPKIQDPIDGLRRLHTAMIETLEGRGPEVFSFGSEPIPGVEEWRNLLLFADRMLREDDSLRLLYSLGAAIGRYQLEFDRRLHPDELPSLEKIQSCAQALSVSTVEAVPELKMLAVSPTEGAGEAQPTLLGRIVGFESGDAKFDADLDNWSRFLMLKRMTKLNYVIQEKLWGLSDAGGERAPECAQDSGTGPVLTRSPYLYSSLQISILTALKGKALMKGGLAKACKVEGTRLYRKNGIKELQALKLVAHQNGIGYFRPDEPPPEMTNLP